MRLKLILALGIASLTGCATGPGQERADGLKAQLDAFAKANPHKDDFIREYGIPTGCAALSAGEICEWMLETGTTSSAYSFGRFAAASSDRNAELVRIEFGSHTEFVSGKVVVRNGEDQYIGGIPRRDSGDQAANSCRAGEIFSGGKCTPLQPVGYSGAPH